MGLPVPKNSGRSLGVMEITAITVKQADMIAVISHRVCMNWVEA